MPGEIHAIYEIYLVSTHGLLLEFQNELLQFIRFRNKKALATRVIYILTRQKKLIMCMQCKYTNLDSAEITSLIEQICTFKSNKMKSFI